MKAQDVYDIADLNYLWGQSVDEPLVAIENIKVNADTLKFFGASGNTLRLTSGCLSFVKFNVKEEEKILLDPGSGFYTVDIVGRCARNFFNDMCTPQIQIEDIRIRNRKTYYF